MKIHKLRQSSLGIITLASLASLPLQAATTFSSDPDLAGSWENNLYVGAVGTPTWNAADQDLDIAAGTTTRWGVLSETGATRAADEGVTLDITSISASSTTPVSPDFALVGIAISTLGSPTLQNASPHYTFSLRGNITSSSENWFYQILDGKNPVNVIHSSANFSVPTSTTTLAIERNGDEYDFLANGLVIYTSSGSYTAAENDGMVNYHIAYGSGNFTTLDATVDNFCVVPVPEPSSTLLLGLSGLALTLRRRR